MPAAYGPRAHGPPASADGEPMLEGNAEIIGLAGVATGLTALD